MNLSVIILGYSAIVIWTISRIIQMKQMYDTKNVEDINFYFLFFDLVGYFLYLIYSILLDDIIIIISSSLPIFFNSILLSLWYKYKKTQLLNLPENTIHPDDILV
jgi:MtN3 and saliva related transmembrane protein